MAAQIEAGAWIPNDRIEATDERRTGAFWFFDRAWPRANSAVYVSVECRVYRIRA